MLRTMQKFPVSRELWPCLSAVHAVVDDLTARLDHPLGLRSEVCSCAFGHFFTTCRAGIAVFFPLATGTSTLASLTAYRPWGSEDTTLSNRLAASRN